MRPIPCPRCGADHAIELRELERDLATRPQPELGEAAAEAQRLFREITDSGPLGWEERHERT